MGPGKSDYNLGDDPKTDFTENVIFVNNYWTNDISVSPAAEGIFHCQRIYKNWNLDHNIGGIRCLGRGLCSQSNFLLLSTFYFFFCAVRLDGCVALNEFYKQSHLFLMKEWPEWFLKTDSLICLVKTVCAEIDHGFFWQTFFISVTCWEQFRPIMVGFFSPKGDTIKGKQHAGIIWLLLWIPAKQVLMTYCTC